MPCTPIEHSWVNVDRTLPVTNVRMGPSTGMLFSWASTAPAIWLPETVPLPLGRLPSGMGGSAVNALEKVGVIRVSGSRACTMLTTGCTTADGLSSSAVPGVPWTLVSQLPRMIGADAPAVPEPATMPVAATATVRPVAAANLAHRECIPRPSGQYWPVASTGKTNVTPSGDAGHPFVWYWSAHIPVHRPIVAAERSAATATLPTCASVLTY